MLLCAGVQAAMESLPSLEVCYFPWAAVTNYHKLGGSEQQEFIPPESWRPEVWNPVLADSRGVSSGFWCLSTFLGTSACPSHLCLHLHVTSLWCVSYKDTGHRSFRPPPWIIQHDLSRLQLLHLRRAFFQIRSPSQVPGSRTWTSLLRKPNTRGSWFTATLWTRHVYL